VSSLAISVMVKIRLLIRKMSLQLH